LTRDSGASVLSRPADADGEYTILCPRARLSEATASLRSNGCDASIAVQDIDYVFNNSNPLYASLAAAIGD
jgi:hypothetical protein